MRQMVIRIAAEVPTGPLPELRQRQEALLQLHAQLKDGQVFHLVVA